MGPWQWNQRPLQGTRTCARCLGRTPATKMTLCPLGPPQLRRSSRHCPRRSRRPACPAAWERAATTTRMRSSGRSRAQLAVLAPARRVPAGAPPPCWVRCWVSGRKTPACARPRLARSAVPCASGQAPHPVSRRWAPAPQEPRASAQRASESVVPAQAAESASAAAAASAGQASAAERRDRRLQVAVGASGRVPARRC